MSKETIEWLNTNTLIGFTDKRGNAWHFDADAQGDEPNHYTGAIPAGDVERRLFNWTAEPRPLFARIPTGIDNAEGIGDDGQAFRSVEVTGKRAITRSDTGEVLAVASDTYGVHQYNDWLVRNVSSILGDTLAIGSAGLLQGGGVAWVSVEVPENITTPEGVEFRPHLLACTSHNATLSSTYKRVVTNVVCDNTMAAGLAESGQTVKIRHTRNSALRLDEARDALAMIHGTADAFTAEVAALCATEVTPKAWAAFLDAHAPIPDDPGRGRTLAENKRDELGALWARDPRVAPWAGTAWGVVQAVNTHTHHFATVRGADRAERNTLRALTGGVDALDAGTLATLRGVLATV